MKRHGLSIQFSAKPPEALGRVDNPCALALGIGDKAVHDIHTPADSLARPDVAYDAALRAARCILEGQGAQPTATPDPFIVVAEQFATYTTPAA